MVLAVARFVQRAPFSEEDPHDWHAPGQRPMASKPEEVQFVVRYLNKTGTLTISRCVMEPLGRRHGGGAFRERGSASASERAIDDIAPGTVAWNSCRRVRRVAGGLSHAANPRCPCARCVS